MITEDNNPWTRIILIAIATVLLVILLMMSSCKSVEYVTVPSVSRDTIYINKVERDSIHVHDSIYLHEWKKGDTVLVEKVKWVTKYVESIKHDTLYQSRVDSVAVPYPVEVKVEKELTWWQNTKMKAGVVLIVLLLGAAVFGILKCLRKFGLV